MVMVTDFVILVFCQIKMTVQKETIQKITAFSLMNETHQLAIIGQHSANFMAKYRRFQLAFVSFTEFVGIISSIEKWFISEECSLLSPNYFSSEAFWLHAASDVNAQVQLPALDLNIV